MSGHSLALQWYLWDSEPRTCFIQDKYKSLFMFPSRQTFDLRTPEGEGVTSIKYVKNHVRLFEDCFEVRIFRVQQGWSVFIVG